MKPKLTLTILTLVLVVGCSSKSGSSSNKRIDCIDCQGLKTTLKYFREEEHAEKVIAGFESEYGHEDGGEMPWEEFEKIIIQSSGCCEGFPHPLSKEWKEYDRLDCIWEYLEKENTQKIAFCRTGMDKDTKRPEDWNHWAEIVEPKKINEVLELIRGAMEKEKDKFADRWIVLANADSRIK